MLILFFVGFNSFEHFAHQKTDGFSLHRIQFDGASQSASLEKMDEKAKSALQQPFHYLGCGNQCFVFVSEDGNYVLKFFKYAHSPIPYFLTKIPLLNRFKPLRPHRFEKIGRKKERDFRGYQLAYEHFREETGLITAHLEPTNCQFPLITIVDKLHISHRLDLNTIPFILQKRAVPIYKQLKAWTSLGQTKQAKRGIASLIQLLKKRIAYGLQDDDVHFYSNFGFVGETAIQVDPGHFALGLSSNPALEIKTVSQELISWCEKHAPLLTSVVKHETLSN